MAETKIHKRPSTKKQHNQKKREKPHSWAALRSIFTCKHVPTTSQQNESSKRCKKMACSGSLCSNTKVMQRPETCSTEDAKKWGTVGIATRSLKAPGNELVSAVSSRATNGGSFRGMQFRRLSGCYECRMVLDPSLGVSRESHIRASLCPCPVCGEIFMKPEALELHQSVRHAVSELGPEDTSRNIVEIIFQSSWLRKQAPVCKIDRILKVQNSQETITRFEEYRDSIKAKANKHVKKHPRCVADGNELLRFHCTTFVCAIGMNGSSNLCNLVPQCSACSIIKRGFKIESEVGICTTATSGKAHDRVGATAGGEKRAMLVCRVIAGRVKSKEDQSVDDYDSVAGDAGIYSDLDELYVFNPKSILPCFLVIYKGY